MDWKRRRRGRKERMEMAEAGAAAAAADSSGATGPAMSGGEGPGATREPEPPEMRGRSKKAGMRWVSCPQISFMCQMKNSNGHNFNIFITIFSGGRRRPWSGQGPWAWRLQRPQRL